MISGNDEFEALVVGAGPTGLALACDLRRRGIDCQVIDRAPRYPTSSRGKGLQPRSLEVLDDLGALQPLLAAGWSRNIRLRWHVAGKLLADLWLPGRDPLPTVPYPNVLLVPQWRTEQALRDRLHELGGSVQLGWELEDLTQDDDEVTATVRDVSAGDRRTIRSRYLVGCDGGHSRVREALGLALIGDTHGEHFVFGDVEIDGLDPSTAYVWVDAERYLAASSFPGQRSWQVQATVHADPQGRFEPGSLELFQRLVNERTGRSDIHLSNPTWLSNYVSNVRMVDRYRVGRAFLAGDAAHVHSPAGGQGMNTGIQDAYNLGWKLDLVLRGRAAEGLLDTYQEERLPVARSVLKGSDIGYTAMFSPNPLITAVRERILVPLLKIPAVQRAILNTSNQLDVNYRNSSLAGRSAAAQHIRPRRLLNATGAGTLLWSRSRPRAGDRAPDAELHDANEAPTRLLNQLHGPQFTLLIFTGQSHTPARLQQLQALAATMEQRSGADVRTRVVIAGSTGQQFLKPRSPVLLDLDGKAHRTYGVSAETLYLLRPDGYVGMSCSAWDLTTVAEYLDTIFEPDHPGRLRTNSLHPAPRLTAPARTSDRSPVHADHEN
ncbi:MAG TPA: FAD-dependent monooxygenase [Propionibacteriaceae bacterium]|nr:FAD-dependent monooxygenase [Propionibacteriaceae bacterium]